MDNTLLKTGEPMWTKRRKRSDQPSVDALSLLPVHHELSNLCYMFCHHDALSHHRLRINGTKDYGLTPLKP
jgi:hypothetical protein